MPTTVSDLIHSAMRLIGSIAAGEQLEPEELADAFVSLNQMLSSWNTEGASLFGRISLTKPVTPAANFVTIPQPIKIDSASMTAGGIDCPLEIVDALGWAAITEIGATAIITRKLYCNYLYPLSNVLFWPFQRVPATLNMWLYSPIEAFTTLDETIDLPQGYEAGLRWNLAVNLAPEYGRPIDQSVFAGAQNFKASLVQLNASNLMRSQTPPAALPAVTQ